MDPRKQYEEDDVIGRAWTQFTAGCLFESESSKGLWFDGGKSIR